MNPNVWPDLIKLYKGVLKHGYAIVGQIQSGQGVLIRLFDKDAPNYDYICQLIPPRTSQDVRWEEIVLLNKVSSKAIRRFTKPKRKERAERRKIKLQARKARRKHTWYTQR